MKTYKHEDIVIEVVTSFNVEGKQIFKLLILNTMWHTSSIYGTSKLNISLHSD